MDNKAYYYPESRFGGYTDIDGTVAFYLRVRALVGSGLTVVDVGCGRGGGAEDPVPVRRGLRDLRGLGGRVIGIDIDPLARQNPLLDEFRLITDQQRWPVAEASVDMVICDNIIEHIEEPEGFFRQVARITRPGAFICIRTPNAWNYVIIASRLIPTRYHGRVLSYVQEGRNEIDIFPSFYRCNTKWKLRKALTAVGFACVVYGYEAEPSYLSFSKFAYSLGVLHQRLAPSLFKSALFAFGQKAR